MKKIKSYLIWAEVVILTFLFKMLNEIKDFMTSATPLSFLVWLILLGFYIYCVAGVIALIKIFLFCHPLYK